MPSIRVVMRWKLQAVVRCLEAWRELTAEEVRKRNVMQRIVSRTRNAGMFAALRRWRENTTEKKALVAKSTRCKSIKSLCVYLVTKRTMYACA